MGVLHAGVVVYEGHAYGRNNELTDLKRWESQRRMVVFYFLRLLQHCKMSLCWEFLVHENKYFECYF